MDDPEESIELPLELGWASLRWEKLHEIRDFRIDMLVPTSLAMFGGGKQRWELSEPQAVAIPASEFKSYLMVQGYEGEYLSIMIDDCMMFETIYLRLHRLRARENVKRMNS